MGKFHVIALDEVSSTNDYLKELNRKEELHENVVVITKSQPGGKGQGSNSWESESGKNLTFSLLLQPSFLPAEKMFLVSKVVSLGLVDCLNSYGKKFAIKWPNDMYYQNKKVAGILIENQLLGNCLKFSVIGIGLNVNQQFFLSDAPNPISMYSVFNKSFELKETLDCLLNHIHIWYEKLQEGLYHEINNSYFQHLYRNSGFHEFRVGEKSIYAKINAVHEDGKMILKPRAGDEQEFYFKEVAFVI